jgi:hypothetical protein
MTAFTLIQGPQSSNNRGGDRCTSVDDWLIVLRDSARQNAGVVG